MEQKNISPHFISLLTSISYAAWQGLGKIPNPMTSKIEKNLESVKISIDMLEMIKEKTKGNLSGEEEKFLTTTISDLQLNYVEVSKEKLEEQKDTKKEELKKEKPKTEEPKKESKENQEGL
jgi:hypothetical protein